MLNVSKVLVAFNCQCFLLRKSAEGSIAANLVDFGQFNGTFRHNVAIVLNSVDSVVKAVQFGEVERNKASVGVFLLGGGKRVVGSWYLRLSVGGSFSFFSRDLGFDSYVDVGVISGEGSKEFVHLVFVLYVEGWEGLEAEVGSASPVEALGGELIFVSICNSHADVVLV